MKTIDCKTISKELRDALKEHTAELEFVPGLAVVLVGDNPASKTYVNNKKKACDEVGFYSEIVHMTDLSTTEEIIETVNNLAARNDIHGVMVQLPLPKHVDVSKVIEAIPAEKDVDALTPISMGKLVLGEHTFAPCTPTGIMAILESEGCVLEGANCAIIGRSNIVGKPLAAMLTQAGATVTLCHSKTKNIAAITRRSDIVVVAVGKPGFLTADMVSPDTIVIDVGINRVADKKLVGDVCFDEVSQVAKAVTPVPGGVGVMTVTSLLMNTYMAALHSTKENGIKGETN